MKKKSLLLFISIIISTLSFGQERIFYANSGSSVNSVEIDGSNNIVIVPGTFSLVLGVHHATNRIFYNSGLSEIISADLDGSNPTTVINGTNVFGIAIDQVNNKIYWSELSLNQVKRADLDGSNEEVLFNVATPSGLAVDPVGGFVYVITYNSTNVYRANLDGTGLATIVPGISGLGIDIVVDATNNKIIYSTRASDIFSANLDGSAHSVLITGQGVVQGLTIDEGNGKLYWSDANAAEIRRSNLDGTTIETVAATGNAYGLAFGAGAMPLSTPLVPTIGEWGLILLALLILSIGTLYSLQPKLQIAGNQNISIKSSSLGDWNIPFNQPLYFKIWVGTILGLMLTFSIGIFFFEYELTNADIPMGILSSGVFAFLMQMLIMGEKEQDSL